VNEEILADARVKRTRRSGIPAVTAKVNNTLNVLLGDFWGSLKVCVISDFGPHRSGFSRFSHDEGVERGLTEPITNFNGVESPNDPIANVKSRLSAHHNEGGKSRGS